MTGGGGVQQVLEALGSHPDDWLYRTAIIEKAAELRRREKRDELEALAKAVGAEVAQTVVKALGGR